MVYLRRVSHILHRLQGNVEANFDSILGWTLQWSGCNLETHIHMYDIIDAVQYVGTGLVLVVLVPAQSYCAHLILNKLF